RPKAGTLGSVRHVAEVGWALARASHPFPAVVVTAMAAGLGVTSGAAPGAAAVLAAAVFAGQLSVGWLNDLVDAERDAAVHRAGKPVAAGAVPRRVGWGRPRAPGRGRWCAPCRSVLVPAQPRGWR